VLYPLSYEGESETRVAVPPKVERSLALADTSFTLCYPPGRAAGICIVAGNLP
jgi:hypothetical protein